MHPCVILVVHGSVGMRSELLLKHSAQHARDQQFRASAAAQTRMDVNGNDKERLPQYLIVHWPFLRPPDGRCTEPDQEREPAPH